MESDSGGQLTPDTRGHPTAKRSWTAKSVCGRIHSDRVALVQIGLSATGEKELSKYRPALTSVFDELSDEDKQHFDRLATEWNKLRLPEDVQQK